MGCLYEYFKIAEIKMIIDNIIEYKKILVFVTILILYNKIVLLV